MTGLLKKAGLTLALGATVLTTAAPAEAQRWRGRHYNRGGGDVAAGAILGGIVGLGVGAAIASNNRGRFDNRGYGRGYGRGGYFAGGPGYYAGGPGYYAQPPRRFYRGGYGYNGYQPRCWTQWQFDPYYGDRVPVQICN